MAAGEPLTLDKMMALFVEEKEPPTRDQVKAAIKAIEQESENRGIELKRVSSGYRFQARKDFSPWVSRLWEEKPARYSRALLETLVLIAYKQPITRGEVEQVRGVAVSTNIIKTLLERDWVKVVGHKEVPGRPALYATTKAFLDYFNLKSLEELPTLAEIRDLESIKPELELELQQPEEGVETNPDAETEVEDTGAEAAEGEVIEGEATEDEAVTALTANEEESKFAEESIASEEPEVSEEEIDINIEDTENIRGVTEATSGVEIEAEEIESEATSVEATNDGAQEAASDEESKFAEETMASEETDISEEEIDNNIEGTENIRDVTESLADEEVEPEHNDVSAGGDEEAVEAVAVDSETDDELVTANEVDSKFAG